MCVCVWCLCAGTPTPNQISLFFVIHTRIHSMDGAVEKQEQLLASLNFDDLDIVTDDIYLEDIDGMDATIISMNQRNILQNITIYNYI